MTHSTLQPLQVLMEQAERDRDEALNAQRRVEATLSAAVDQQDQLCAYRSDYEQRWGAQLRGGVTMTLMQCYQDFRSRLVGAVDQQGQQVARLQTQLDAARTATLAAELRVAAVRKLIERREQALWQRSERREQKQQDEFASRAAWQRGASASVGAWPEA